MNSSSRLLGSARSTGRVRWRIAGPVALVLALTASFVLNAAPPAEKGGPRLGQLQSLEPRTTTRERPPKPDTNAAPIQMRIGPYLGWERSLTIANPQVEAVVVPAIGRVMQFRAIGQPGPFWEDPSLRGRPADPASAEWINFGGDKTWPAPQTDWEKQTTRSWPPPVAFDSMPVEAFVRRDTVVLVSPTDPHYGIRTERVIQLAHDRPEMTVTTTYEKILGAPVKVGVWIITQLEDPVAVFAPIPARSRFLPEGFDRQSGDDLPAQLRVRDGLLSLRRDPAKSTKIGTDASRLLWIGSTQMLLIESPRIADVEYPDQGSSAEVYTNPDPKTYVELEMLGPLRTLAPGDRLSQTNTYRLIPRRNPDPAADARRVLLSQEP